MVRAALRTVAGVPDKLESMTMARSFHSLALAMLAFLSLGVLPALAQVESVDPDAAIDGDLVGGSSVPAAPSIAVPETAGNGTPIDGATPAATEVDSWKPGDFGDAASPSGSAGAEPQAGTYHQDDLMGAAEGVFGKGSQGLASMIEDILKKQGEPNGYITGREAGGAIALGIRYGSGTLHHKIEGDRPVYWTGPSLGFDLGMNAGKAFVLVYNLHDTQDLYHRFGAGEGQAYLVGGFHISYLRRGDVVLIPVRMGAGLRLGANVGYMRISQKQRWLPF